uniref:DUF4780 domain-containing protein n=1 Tax=Stomoxys calcitrans TaxID=35570 RepID=A0A1I8PC82_STOCA
MDMASYKRQKIPKREQAFDEIRRLAYKFVGKSVPDDFQNIKEEHGNNDVGKESFENSRLKMELLNKKESKIFKKIFEKRLKLSAVQKGFEFLEAYKIHQVLLVVGSKKSGRSTQIPQILLDEYILNNKASECRIACVQIMAHKVETMAKEVAHERDEVVGKSVGYHSKRGHIPPRDNGSILFCTAGMLFHRFKDDPFLKKFSAVILDDMQDRTFEYTQVMRLLSIMLPFRRDFKVIMLASHQCKRKFAEFFKHYDIFNIDEGDEDKVNNDSILENDFKSHDGRANNSPKVGSTPSSDYLDNWNLKNPQEHKFSSADISATISDILASRRSMMDDNNVDDDNVLEGKCKKMEHEYRCSIEFLSLYIDSDLQTISDLDRALINSNRKNIIKFERRYPHLADKKSVFILEKTDLNSVVASALSQNQSATVSKADTFKSGSSSRTSTTAVHDLLANRMQQTRDVSSLKNVETNETRRFSDGTAVKRTAPSNETPQCSKKHKSANHAVPDSYNLQVAIIDRADLDGNIYPANWLVLEEKLLQEMISDRWCDEIISFDGTEWSGGVKVIKCANEKSLEFLKATVTGIGELWPRAQLDVIPQSHLPIRSFISMWIPPPVPATRHVFELLGRQNKDLVTDNWQILSTIPCENGTTFRLAIDVISFRRLQSCQGRVRFGFGFITIQPE